MSIQGPFFDPTILTGKTGKTSGAGVGFPQNLSADMRFKNILTMMQDDGIIAKDAPAGGTALTDDQKNQLRGAFNIGDMASYADKRGLLNQLVTMGALTAEESELSMCQLLPPQGPGGGLQTGLSGFGGWENDELEATLSEPNYLTYLEKAMEFDNLWNRSADVKNARSKVHDILQDIFT